MIKDFLHNATTLHFCFLCIGIFTTANSVEELNNLMRKRLFSMWHDHSTVAGRSHFLVLVAMVYDPLVFLTPKEYEAKYKTK